MTYFASSRHARLQLDAADRAADRADAQSMMAHAGFLATYAEAMTEAAVDEARAAGHTWQEVGDMLGMSKQGAQQRFGRGEPIE
jgi:hypothetical protein